MLIKQIEKFWYKFSSNFKEWYVVNIMVEDILEFRVVDYFQINFKN